MRARSLIFHACLGLVSLVVVGFNGGVARGHPAEQLLAGSVSFPDVVVSPPGPPAGPIPIPYPNSAIRRPGVSFPLAAFRLAGLRTRGVIDVQDAVLD